MLLRLAYQNCYGVIQAAVFAVQQAVLGAVVQERERLGQIQPVLLAERSDVRFQQHAYGVLGVRGHTRAVWWTSGLWCRIMLG